MKISLNWLKKYITLEESPEEIAHHLTSCGLEVGHVTSTLKNKEFLKDLVVGRVVTCDKHPNADRLKLLDVSIGLEKNLQIVCGAPNVDQGQRVIIAPVGAKIMNSAGGILEIKKTKIRGSLSEGMVCSQYEIGLGEESDGIFVYPEKNAPPVGTKLLDLLSDTEDVVLEIELTPNRGDAASHVGVARDLSARLDRELIYPKLGASFCCKQKNDPPCPISIDIPAGIGCSRYTGVVIKNVQLKDSPEWLRQSLAAIGVEPKNNIVDLTNYVMYELGHPMHAYDCDLLVGRKIFLEKAQPNTTMRTLDGLERIFNDEELLIYDGEGPICVAGVIGGARTAISSGTKNIFLELACFPPKTIRNSAKAQCLHTEASFRFERGAAFDPHYPLSRAVDLILSVAGGEVCGGVADQIVEEQPMMHEVLFRFKTLEKISGIKIPVSQIKKIITRLEIEIKSEGGAELLLAVPAFKADVSREIDVVEEVLRIYGYDRMPTADRITFPSFEVSGDTASNASDAKKNICALLVSRGFYEIRTNPIVNSNYYGFLENESLGHVALLNPNSSILDSMRSTLIFSGLETIAYNRNRHRDDYCKFFEFGRVYTLHDETVRESNRLCIWMSGAVLNKNWYDKKSNPSFHHLSTHVYDVLWKILGVKDFLIKKVKTESLSEAIELSHDGSLVATLGKVYPSLNKKFDLNEPTFFADLNWDLLLAKSTQRVVYKPLSKYPTVQRDVSMLITQSTCFDEIKKAVETSTESKLIESIELIDVYAGNDLPEAKKSYSLRITLQPHERTLTSDEIASVMQGIEGNLKSKLDAQIR